MCFISGNSTDITMTMELILVKTCVLSVVLVTHLQCVKSLERTARSDDQDAVQALVEQQAQVIAQLQAKVIAMETRLAKQETQVAFNARLTSDASQTVSTDQGTIVFHSVDINQGNGYEALTGIFRAPVSGMYQFNLKITHVPPGNMHVHVVKEQHVIAETNSSGGNDGDRSTATVIVHLGTGQRVWVVRESGTATQLSGAYGTSFSGFLISAD